MAERLPVELVRGMFELAAKSSPQHARRSLSIVSRAVHRWTAPIAWHTFELTSKNSEAISSCEVTVTLHHVRHLIALLYSEHLDRASYGALTRFPLLVAMTGSAAAVEGYLVSFPCSNLSRIYFDHKHRPTGYGADAPRSGPRPRILSGLSRIPYVGLSVAARTSAKDIFAAAAGAEHILLDVNLPFETLRETSGATTPLFTGSARPILALHELLARIPKSLKTLRVNVHLRLAASSTEEQIKWARNQIQAWPTEWSKHVDRVLRVLQSTSNLQKRVVIPEFRTMMLVDVCVGAYATSFLADARSGLMSDQCHWLWNSSLDEYMSMRELGDALESENH